MIEEYNRDAVSAEAMTEEQEEGTGTLEEEDFVRSETIEPS